MPDLLTADGVPIVVGITVWDSAAEQAAERTVQAVAVSIGFSDPVFVAFKKCFDDDGLRRDDEQHHKLLYSTRDGARLARMELLRTDCVKLQALWTRKNAEIEKLRGQVEAGE